MAFIASGLGLALATVVGLVVSVTRSPSPRTTGPVKVKTTATPTTSPPTLTPSPSTTVTPSVTAVAVPPAAVLPVTLKPRASTPRAGPTPPPSPPPTTPAPALTTPAPPPGTLTRLSFDSFTWAVLSRDGDQSNSEVGCYTPSNVSVGSGMLDIHTQTGSCPPPNNFLYTSSMVQWDTFHYTYGTLEARVKMPGGQGTWPGLWLLGSDCQVSNHTTPDNVLGCNWHHNGSQEIDIAEKLCGNSCMNEELWADSGNTQCRPDTLSDVTANWHTYTLVWTPGSLIWKIDGVQTCSATNGVPTTPMFLIVNTAVGGSGGGRVDASTFPQDFQVDYVRITSP